MKKAGFLIFLAAVLAAELIALGIFALGKEEAMQDTVAVNEVVKSVQQDWERLGGHENQTGLAYVVLNREGAVVYRTSGGLSETVNEAVRHRDTILDVVVSGDAVGKIIISNQGGQLLSEERKKLAAFFALAVLVQGGVYLGYGFYWQRRVIGPFEKLRGFARRVAEGNLDIPLEMDRKNLFGAFTESFDLMREELKRAQLAEAEANASKKELIAKLSHDIRTPVASIKAAAEVGQALSGNEKDQVTYAQIICKADQINTLVTNLFHATLEELRQLTVAPKELEGREIQGFLENADYLQRACIPELPPCLVYADPLRLQQVFDNLFANSYKYADTGITVSAALEGRRLVVVLEDAGGGVPAEELPLLKEKFWRGSNRGGKEGAGLGLYLSNYFLEGMGGTLVLENGEKGLRALVGLPLCGEASENNHVHRIYTFDAKK